MGIIQHVLHESDVFVDVGANIGIISLEAARHVGRTGRVLSFEPNPDARCQLRLQVLANNLQQVSLQTTALSDQEGELILNVPGRSGLGPLRPLEDTQSDTYQVAVSTLDSYARDLEDSGRLFLKIDTEGFDFNVLKGASEILERKNIVVYYEVNDKWLREIGQSADEMLDYMVKRGFRAFLPALQRPAMRHSICFREVLSAEGLKNGANLLFTREDFSETMLQVKH